MQNHSCPKAKYCKSYDQDSCQGCMFIDSKYSEVEIKEVIFNNPATIVLWDDGSKTVVKCSNETYDPEKGLAMAIAKKMFGNKGNYFNHIKKWTSNI